MVCNDSDNEMDQLGQAENDAVDAIQAAYDEHDREHDEVLRQRAARVLDGMQGNNEYNREHEEMRRQMADTTRPLSTFEILNLCLDAHMRSVERMRQMAPQMPPPSPPARITLTFSSNPNLAQALGRLPAGLPSPDPSVPSCRSLDLRHVTCAVQGPHPCVLSRDE